MPQQDRNYEPPNRDRKLGFGRPLINLSKKLPRLHTEGFC
jgi:hypothetical protein